MATADQIKSLIRSHFSNETERFYTIALQVAAHEAKQGHPALAHDIRDIVEREQNKRGPKVLNFPQDLRGLVLTEDPQVSKTSLVIQASLHERIQQVIHEYRQQNNSNRSDFLTVVKSCLSAPQGRIKPDSSGAC